AAVRVSYGWRTTRERLSPQTHGPATLLSHCQSPSVHARCAARKHRASQLPLQHWELDVVEWAHAHRDYARRRPPSSEQLPQAVSARRRAVESISPGRGDVVVRRQRTNAGYVYTIEQYPGTPQVMCHLPERAMRFALAFAEHHDVLVWTEHDGTYVR